MQAVQIGEAADVGIADENLRYAALPGKLLHFGKGFGASVYADFVDFGDAQRMQQLFGHGAVGAERACVHRNGLHDCFQSSNGVHYMGIWFILQYLKSAILPESLFSGSEGCLPPMCQNAVFKV